jgi:HAE1 family hydrophobic/amphiphilic exporter-1
MNFAQFSVTRPVAVTMRIAALVLLGAICLTRLPIDLLPKVSFPTVAVVTQWPNVAPEEIEAQVTRPVEQAVSSVPGLYQVNSQTAEGVSTVRVQFQWGTDIGQGAVDVLQLVERARQRFPVDPTLQSPVVYKYDPSQLPIMIFGVSGEKDPVKLRTLLDNQVSPMLESADGVASAVISGGQQRAIIIDVDPARLRSHHLSLDDVNRRIAAENLNLPAGIAKQGDTEYTIRSLGWFLKPDDIREIPVGSFNGQVVPLKDIADVRDSHSETRLYTRLNGEPAVGVIITKQSGANTVTTAAAVHEKIKQVNKIYPELKFGLAYDQSQFIGGSIRDLRDNALLGGALAVLILLFFLRNFRSTMVVALSIPISIVSTFALLYMCGFTLNTMSLGGLALATGLIVDDAVVVLENIFRHIERDKKRAAEAAVSGTNEIASAVVASTITVMVVFLPLLLIKGQSGQMFTQFALVVIFSIAVSLLDATTVVPMLASRLIQGDAHHEDLADGHKRNLIERLFHQFGVWLDALDHAYRNGLRWAIKHRIWVIGAAATATAASLLLVPQLGVELMPQTDSGDFTITVKMPPGTSLEKTNGVVNQIEGILKEDPNVNTAFSAAGTTLNLRGATAALIPFQGSFQVKLKDDRKLSTLDVMNNLRRKFGQVPGLRALVNQVDLVTMIMTGGNQNVEVDIFGSDLTTLSNLGKDVIARVRGIPGFENVDVNWQESMPEIQWKVDRSKALQLGLDFNTIANTINTATNGTIASYYQEEGFQYPIIVQLPENKRKTVADLRNLALKPMSSTNVDPVTGLAMPSRQILLSQVAHDVNAYGPSEIWRIDRQRYIAVMGQPQGRSAGEIQADVQKALAGFKLPQGYYWDWGTIQKRRAEEFSGMILAIVLAIGLIYMLLASQFESFIHPLTVLLSVPLSAIGVVLALFLSGRAFGLTAFIGLLMLVGIVVKNGILLVDYTNVLRGRGMGRDDAVLQAGPTRLRPILMTTCAAVLGMLPIAIGFGKGSETQAPMATAVIGGLVTSTMLTLFIIPTVYTIFDDMGRHLRRNKMDLDRALLVEPTLEAVERENVPAAVVEGSGFGIHEPNGDQYPDSPAIPIPTPNAQKQNAQTPEA